MQRFEYKVIPAPTKGEKTRAAKTTADRFSVALSNLMNELGSEGWDYVRADTLPCEERVGFTGSRSTFLNMLVFRRVLDAEPSLLAEPMFTSVKSEPLRPVLLTTQSEGAAPALGPALARE
jgi:Domain of unknown function (DUF4177)